MSCCGLWRFDRTPFLCYTSYMKCTVRVFEKYGHMGGLHPMAEEAYWDGHNLVTGAPMSGRYITSWFNTRGSDYREVKVALPSSWIDCEV